MKFKVEKMMCGGCAGNVKAKLEALDAMKSAEVDLDSGIVVMENTVEGAVDAQMVVDILADAGYPTELVET